MRRKSEVAKATSVLVGIEFILAGHDDADRTQPVNHVDGSLMRREYVGQAPIGLGCLVDTAADKATPRSRSHAIHSS